MGSSEQLCAYLVSAERKLACADAHIANCRLSIERALGKGLPVEGKQDLLASFVETRDRMQAYCDVVIAAVLDPELRTGNACVPDTLALGEHSASIDGGNSLADGPLPTAVLNDLLARLAGVSIPPSLPGQTFR